MFNDILKYVETFFNFNEGKSEKEIQMHKKIRSDALNNIIIDVVNFIKTLFVSVQTNTENKVQIQPNLKNIIFENIKTHDLNNIISNIKYIVKAINNLDDITLKKY